MRWFESSHPREIQGPGLYRVLVFPCAAREPTHGGGKRCRRQSRLRIRRLRIQPPQPIERPGFGRVFQLGRCRTRTNAWRREALPQAVAAPHQASSNPATPGKYKGPVYTGFLYFRALHENQRMAKGSAAAGSRGSASGVFESSHPREIQGPGLYRVLVFPCAAREPTHGGGKRCRRQSRLRIRRLRIQPPQRFGPKHARAKAAAEVNATDFDAWRAARSAERRQAWA